MADDLLEGLNPEQREAVLHTDGPLLVLAGPGSGKTRVITRRAARLARDVTRAHHVLCITFTNKAAREMRQRIEATGVAEGMTIGTFHAFCARLLRIHHDRAGVARYFTIYDTQDRRKLIADAVAECGLSTTNWSPARIEVRISRAKNALLTPTAFSDGGGDFSVRTIARVYATYEAMMADREALDFDDLLMKTALMLEHDPVLRDELEDHYRYVLIDEYQDTNVAQYRIARLLTRERHNLCATGDPDQSIYAWRGADIENILSFERDFREAHVVRLERNYRSTALILNAADAVIVHNDRRRSKVLRTEAEPGHPVRVLECEDGKEEAARIAGDILVQMDAGADPGGIAVFYRLNSLSRVLEEQLIRAGIRYQVARGVEFYNRREVKDVLAYIRVLLNPSDETALLRIINMPPRGIGETTVSRLSAKAAAKGIRLFDLLMQEKEFAFAGRSGAKVAMFVETLRTLRNFVELPAAEAVDRIASHSGLRAHYHATETDDTDSATRNIDELVSAAADFSREYGQADLMSWVEHAALLGDVDAVEDGPGLVTLMTLHAAKGLEYDVVYIVGIEEGLLPFRRSEDDDALTYTPNDMEEERRLLFVGMTRARKRLTLSYARFRALRGGASRTVRSPFLDELPRKGVECSRGSEAEARGSRSGGGFEASLPPDIELWQPGVLVRHEAHGLGKVLSIYRGAGNVRVEVVFRNGDRRSLVLGYAPLTRVPFDEVG